jgi:hypothetical protein
MNVAELDGFIGFLSYCGNTSNIRSYEKLYLPTARKINILGQATYLF